MTLFMLGGTAYAVVVCVSVVRSLFSARCGLTEHNKTMAELDGVMNLFLRDRVF
jgi:hypothetical protein